MGRTRAECTDLGGYEAVHEQYPEERSDDACQDGGEDDKSGRALCNDGAIRDELERKGELVEEHQGSQFDAACTGGSVWVVGRGGSDERTDCGLSLVYMENEDTDDEEGDTTDDHVRYIARVAVAGQRWPTCDLDSNWRDARVGQGDTSSLG
jgi:hypothetical protein